MVVLVIFILSLSRGMALYNNYNAPMKLYNHVSTLKSCDNQQGKVTCSESADGFVVNVCIGKEWYRFSSGYFFPNNHFNLTFVKDGPQSQVPFPFIESLTSCSFRSITPPLQQRYNPTLTIKTRTKNLVMYWPLPEPLSQLLDRYFQVSLPYKE